MAQEETYIAVVSEQLSKPGDTRYVIINRQTREVADDCGGHGYKSAGAAHKSFAFKQRRRQQGQTARQMRQQYQSAGGRQSASGRQYSGNPQSAGGRQPQELVSPFVQEASAGYQRPAVVRDDGAPQVTHVNTWSGYAPRRTYTPRTAPTQTVQAQTTGRGTQRTSAHQMVQATRKNSAPPTDQAGQTGVHAYRSTPDGCGRATNRGMQSPSYSRQHRRPQDVSQENTVPPPDLFDFQSR